MKKIFKIFFILIFFQALTAGLFTGASAPLYDRGGVFLTAASGQETSPPAGDLKSDKRSDVPECGNCGHDVLYRVMLITLVIWIGISLYLVFLHVKIASLEKMIDEK